MSKILELDWRGLRKIISGGQVGVDRGALDATRAFSISTGGTAPARFRVDNGFAPELAEYGLVEHVSSDYPPRTRCNVKDSNATLIIASNPNSPGTILTANLTRELKKPLLIINLKTDLNHAENVDRVVSFIVENEVEILNVAGNRDRNGIARHHSETCKILTDVFVVLASQNLIKYKE